MRPVCRPTLQMSVPSGSNTSLRSTRSGGLPNVWTVPNKMSFPCRRVRSQYLDRTSPIFRSRYLLLCLEAAMSRCTGAGYFQSKIPRFDCFDFNCLRYKPFFPNLQCHAPDLNFFVFLGYDPFSCTAHKLRIDCFFSSTSPFPALLEPQIDCFGLRSVFLFYACYNGWAR